MDALNFSIEPIPNPAAESRHDSAVSNTPRKANRRAQLPAYSKGKLEKDVIKETHEAVDKSENATMSKTIICNIHPLPQLVIPDSALDMSVKEMLEGLKEEGFYVESRWVGWKDDKSMSEQDVCAYFNKLADAVDRMREARKNRSIPNAPLASDDGAPSQSANVVGPKLRWSFAAMNKPLHGDQMKRKPDLICIREGDPAEWYYVHACVEKKPETMDALEALRQGRGVAKIMFRAQQNRRFVIGCTVAGDAIELTYTDRSGTFTSGMLKIHENPEDLVRVAVGLTLIEPQDLGYDTTLSIIEGAGEVTVCGTVYKVRRNIFAESSIEGRGTMCFEVQDPQKEGSTYVLKDAWVDVTRDHKEADILKNLNDLGITNIPKVVASEIVRINGRDDSTKYIRQKLQHRGCLARKIPHPKPDTRAKAAKEVGENTAEDGKAAHEKPKMKKKLELAKRRRRNKKLHPLRNHHRIIMDPYGKEFCKFRCLEEFLLAVKDIVSVIKQLYDNNYLHRDVSINNVVLAEREEDAFQSVYKRLQGFLIDYDYALWLGRDGPRKGVKVPVTGTVPFMAVDLLEHFDGTYAHDYQHDLESLFYVICWICTVHSGPNGKCRSVEEIVKSNIYSWNVHDFSEKNLKQIARTKSALTKIKETFRTSIEEDFHPYFAPIFDCLCDMRDCLFPTKMDEDDHEIVILAANKLKERKDAEGIRKFRKKHLKLPHAERDSNVVFDELFAVIDDARETLSEEHRLKKVYPPPPEKDVPPKEKHEEDDDDDDDKEYDDDVLFDLDDMAFIDATDGTGVIQSVGDGANIQFVALPLTKEGKGKSRTGGSIPQAGFVPSSSGSKRKATEEIFPSSRSSRQRTNPE
ncbi:hypothetical protein SCHPADRAFT_946555 [Schizopora paradoxa]|uniref:Protein kinase domain-containing protein n=1 Tax=Schizopora paradoxa TaxID=27342 RepID=A0A0H2R3F3_9AGAM|nr:hypothetical protein SCHPADRAFT_946555 [Schizopora paradoxa]